MIPLIGFSLTTISRTILKDSISNTTALALILNEHSKLSKENPLLKKEIQQLKELNTLCEEKDSLRLEEIKVYENELNKSNTKLKKAKSTLKKILLGSSIGGIVLFLIGLIL